MKFKHFTMEELEKMTQDQQRGYVLAEIMYGYGCAMTEGMKTTPIPETMSMQLKMIKFIDKASERALKMLKDALTTDTGEFEEMLKKAVGAPNALNYE